MRSISTAYPGLTANTYISSMQSPYHPWFIELGYPDLDIKEFRSGEWAIIQYLSSPVIPSLTKWKYVLSGMRNILITRGFIERYVEQLDTSKKAIWEREEQATRDAEEAHRKREEHANETADEMTKAFMKNDALMERFARQGASALRPESIMQHINPLEAREILKSCM